MMTAGGPAWPRKYDLFGVQVSATTYDETVEAISRAAQQRLPAVVSLYPVHGIITASSDAVLRQRVNGFEVVAPDGQPVRWALNLLHRTGLRDRVYGPELMLRLCEGAANDNVAVYLYGSSAPVVEALRANLLSKFPHLRIAGAESPPFRPLSKEEDAEVVQRINDSGAGVVFVGLGCPKQDHFAFEHRNHIRAVQVCVGAAFDFHAGTKRMAPRWMQRSGLEWLFRLLQEPQRLWRRYFFTNALFVVKLAIALCRRQVSWHEPAARNAGKEIPHVPSKSR